MPYYCTVPRCTSMAGKAKNVSFHQFPRDEELAKLWNRILKRGKPYTKYSKVCSLHFKPEDYTITSVGKNKGQWRTLRKDAIPSQNLPSESPAPYTRRSSGYWAPTQPTLVDPLVQQQMAQAIYMQTMLAMQAAGSSESLPNSDQPLQMPDQLKPSPSGSSLSEIELLLRRDTETTPKDVTYKCQECSKCFKDPDVFLLHKRTHKNDTLTNNIEKENYSTNIQDSEETLRANPILANLLKTSMRLAPESNISNILSVENQIMTALASNMEAYIRTLTSMLSSQTNTGTGSEDREDKSEASDDYEDETRDDKDEESNDPDTERYDAKVECDDGNEVHINQDDNMGIDTNDRDMTMNEDDVRGIRDDVAEAKNVYTTYENQNDTSLVEVEGINGSFKSKDEDHTLIDENYKCTSDDRSINYDNKRDIDQSQNDTHENHHYVNNKIDSTADETYNVRNDSEDKNQKSLNNDKTKYKAYKDDNDAIIVENHKCPSDDKLHDVIRNEAYEDKEGMLIDDNHEHTNYGKSDDNYTAKDETIYEDIYEEVQRDIEIERRNWLSVLVAKREYEPSKEVLIASCENRICIADN